MTEVNPQAPGEHKETSVEPVESKEKQVKRLTEEMMRLYLLTSEQAKVRNAVVEGKLDLNAHTLNLIQNDLSSLRAKLIEVEAELRLLDGDPRFLLRQRLVEISSQTQPEGSSAPAADTPDAELKADAEEAIADPIVEQEMYELDSAARLVQADATPAEAEEALRGAEILNDLARPDLEALEADQAELLQQLERERRRGKQ